MHLCSTPNSQSQFLFYGTHLAQDQDGFMFGVIQKVRSLRRGGEGVTEKRTKTNELAGGGGGGERALACVYIRFFKKKILRFLKMKFYGYSPVFLIDYNGSMKYHHERL